MLTDSTPSSSCSQSMKSTICRREGVSSSITTLPAGSAAAISTLVSTLAYTRHCDWSASILRGCICTIRLEICTVSSMLIPVYCDAAFHCLNVHFDAFLAHLDNLQRTYRYTGTTTIAGITINTRHRYWT